MSKIDKQLLLRMRAEGRSKSECARYFHVTPGAIGQLERGIRDQIEAAPEINEQTLGTAAINTMDQLKRINDVILVELNRCGKLINEEDRKLRSRKELEKKFLKNKDDKTQAELVEALKTTYNDILKIQNNVISISAEVRKQLEFQVKIAEIAYGIQQVAEFQEELIQVLGTIDVKAKDAFVKKLKERRAVRGLIKLDR